MRSLEKKGCLKNNRMSLEVEIHSGVSGITESDSDKLEQSWLLAIYDKKDKGSSKK